MASFGCALLISIATVAAQQAATGEVSSILASFVQLKSEGSLPGLRAQDILKNLTIDPTADTVRKDWFNVMAPDVAGSERAYVVAVEMSGRKLKYLFLGENTEAPVSACVFNGITWDRLPAGAQIERNLTETNAEGFRYIFNGRSLKGWSGDTTHWSVAGGVLSGRIKPGVPAARVNSFLIWTNGVVDNFELRLSFRFPIDTVKPYGNSGVQYRSVVLDAATWSVGGYQADLEAGTNYSGVLYDQGHITGGRSVLAVQGEKVIWDEDCKKQTVGLVGIPGDIQGAIKHTEWNDYTIIAQGNRLRHFINGVATVDVTDECPSRRLDGVLALQLRGDRAMTVQFKDIRLKRLPPAEISVHD